MKCSTRYVRQQTLENGATGRVAFDDNGDRIYAEYDVVNSRLSNKFVSVGQYYYSSLYKQQNEYV
ncbi:hypothetical protein TSAR_013752 [Trichomalopsis sarcophagae]|uniref:Uncharacterized protein n=1 Tax=Trichomalopsis sarcophagae TaxID=543379 RepID=A0A232FMN4_9HYME|nr:hypothetical protein TSAR_013752 [Trichomalopsis sarcophagae]